MLTTPELILRITLSAAWLVFIFAGAVVNRIVPKEQKGLRSPYSWLMALTALLLTAAFVMALSFR
jgi:hypothetical protein